MKRKSDLRLVLCALLLLIASAVGWLWLSAGSRERREATLATVPGFPAPGQPLAMRRTTLTARAPAPFKPPEQLGPAPRPSAPVDRLNNFALAKTRMVGVVQLNALLNTPLFDKLRECMPEEFSAEGPLDTQQLGFDLQRDVDRVAVTEEGVAVSGFFEGKPIAENLAGKDAVREEYRGQTILKGSHGCVAQLGNLLIVGEGDCHLAIDHALTPPADVNASNELYGDVYFRADTSALREQGAGTEPGNPLAAVLGALDGVTMRANVWDSVALTVEGSPSSAGNSAGLAEMARAGIALAKSQLGDDDVELRTLAELAQVESQGGKLNVNLALPVKDLFERLHFPCPGRAGRDGGLSAH